MRKKEGHSAVSEDVVTVEGLSVMTGWSKSHIYKMTHKSLIPFYKPLGKTIFFKRSEIEDFLFRNRQECKEVIDSEARDFVHLESKLI